MHACATGMSSMVRLWQRYDMLMLGLTQYIAALQQPLTFKTAS